MTAARQLAVTRWGQVTERLRMRRGPTRRDCDRDIGAGASSAGSNSASIGSGSTRDGSVIDHHPHGVRL
jgi:hypothetical protein